MVYCGEKSVSCTTIVLYTKQMIQTNGKEEKLVAQDIKQKQKKIHEE